MVIKLKYCLQILIVWRKKIMFMKIFKVTKKCLPLAIMKKYGKLSKLVIGKMKYETSGIPVKEFIKLK